MVHTITAIVFSCIGCLQGKVNCHVCLEPNPRHPPARYQQHTVGLEWNIPSLPLPTLVSAACKEKSTTMCAYSLNIFWFPCINLCTSPLVDPLPSSSENGFLFTVIDQTTPRLEAFLLESITATDCAVTLYSRLIQGFGVPFTITSNRGLPLVRPLSPTHHPA
jgi:hypothetical protein